MTEALVKANFHDKFEYLSDEEVDSIYDTALATWLDLKFPLHPEIVAIPSEYPRAYLWIKDCMNEIMERNGITATSYSENGLSYEWDSGMVSMTLLRRIGCGKGRVVS